MLDVESGRLMLISTARFVLRDLVETDRRAFITFQIDPRYRGLYAPGLTDESQADVLFDRLLSWQRENPRRNIRLGIFEKGGSRLCGYVGLRKDPQRKDLALFEIELAPAYRRRYRMAVEITEALLDFGFRYLDLNIVVGVTASGNEPASRLARWFGAKVLTLRRGPLWMRERGWHEIDWALTRHDWEARRDRSHGRSRPTGDEA